MSKEQFIRTELLLGTEGMERLKNAHVIVFGVGGVGGHVVEALVRSGISHISIVDDDTVCESNLNRQIIATWKTIGKSKVEAMKERILEINPECEVITHACFYLPETAEQFDFTKYDYVVDAIDTVTAKIDLAVRTTECKVPLISSMGAGNKLDPTRFEVTDIYKTSVCPLAKVMRRELKKRNIPKLKVVYSKEEALTPISLGEMSDARQTDANCKGQENQETITHKKRATPGSTAFVPAVAGLIIAGEVIKDLTKKELT